MKDSPMVQKMIEDVKNIYTNNDDGCGSSDGISVYFIEDWQKFIVSQDYSFQMPTCDGGIYTESENMWEESYTWNEMTMWCINNRNK